MSFQNQLEELPGPFRVVANAAGLHDKVDRRSMQIDSILSGRYIPPSVCELPPPSSLFDDLRVTGAEFLRLKSVP
jgi:hypothetical protein